MVDSDMPMSLPWQMKMTQYGERVRQSALRRVKNLPPHARTDPAEIVALDYVFPGPIAVA